MNGSSLSLDPVIRIIFFITTISLLLLLTTKELGSLMDSKLVQRITRFINGSIISLLIVFVVIVIIVISSILR
jgi:hypothetical protein